MTKVIFNISVSLDGFATASDVRPEEPMGDGGQLLHEWAHGADERGREVLVDNQRNLGASIAGRRTHDLSLPWWGADGPEGAVRTPTFIVSHSEPKDVPEGGVYTFVGSPEEALAGATAVAGDKNVDVFSPSIGQQLLRAGHVDKIWLHVVPLLLGSGTRLFEDIGGEHVRLETISVVESPTVTHLRFRVVK